MFREPADRPPTPGGVKRPALFWTALVAILFILALLVPTDWTESFAHIFESEPANKMTAWSDPVDRVDARLREGKQLELSAAELDRMLPLLQVRRLYDAGPMNVQNAERAEAIFREFQSRIEAQELDGSREALRTERNDRIARALPRLDREKMAASLQELREQLADATSGR